MIARLFVACLDVVFFIRNLAIPVSLRAFPFCRFVVGFSADPESILCTLVSEQMHARFPLLMYLAQNASGADTRPKCTIL
jgi:hypothetical protein